MCDQARSLKTQRIIHVLVILVFMFTVLVTPQSANACSCLGVHSVYHTSQIIEQNDAVFVGRVVGNFSLHNIPAFSNTVDKIRSSLPINTPGRNLLFRRYVTLEVVDSWKGIETKRIRMIDSSQGSCGFDFSLSEEYLVFASKYESDYAAGLCSGTTFATDETAEYALGYLETVPTIPLTWVRPINMVFAGAIIIVLYFAVLSFGRKSQTPPSLWRRNTLFGSMGIAILLIVNGLIMEPIQRESEANIAEIVASQADLDRAKPLASRGWVWAIRFGCIDCHQFDRTSLLDLPASSLRGIYGREIQLADGTTITADEAYIRNAIIDPEVHTYEGFIPAPMPYGYEGLFIDKMQGRLSDATQVDVLTDIVEFIKTLEEPEE